MKKHQRLSKSLSKLVKPLILVALFVVGSTSNSVFAQNWDQIIKIAASDRGIGDEFGISVAISGDHAIVGAWKEEYDTTGGNILYGAGAAYIFKNIAGTWTEVQKIVATDRGTNDWFGCSVAISGDYAIVGAYREDHDATGGDVRANAGSAYIFKNNGGIWSQVQKIVASDRGSADEFGCSVAISGEYAVVGAVYQDKDATGENYVEEAGSAYIFKNNAGTWSQVQKIVASSRGKNDKFGYSVAISGDNAIVGAVYEKHNAVEGDSLYEAGSAYIFKNNAGTWSQVQKIVASDRETSDHFGVSVAISGDHAIVGAYNEDHDATGGNYLYDAGSAYIFKDNAGTWTEVQKIVASERGELDYFGRSVAISGDYAIVGAIYEDHDSNEGNYSQASGSAYIFKNNAGTWPQVQKIVASDRKGQVCFGSSVGIWGDHALVGAYYETNNATGGDYLYKAGSAYIFKNDTTIIGIVVNNLGDRLVVYPNPGNGNFTIDMGAIYENAQLKITDISGKLINSRSISQSQIFNLSIEEPAGIYIVTIQADNKKAVLRLVKE